MMHIAGRGQNHGAARRKSQSYQALASDLDVSLAFGRDLHDAALSRERCRNVQVTVHIEREPLRPAQALVKGMDSSARIDAINTIKTGSGWAGHEQVPFWTERQVVRGNTGLQRGKDEHLLVTREFEDGALPVPDVETLLAIERDTCRHTHTLGEGCHGSVGGHPVDGAVVARGNVHLPLTVEGDGGRVHHLDHKRFHGVVGINLEDRDRDFLATGTGECNVEIAFCIQCRIGDRVEIVGNGDGDLDCLRIADVPVGRDDDWTGGRTFWYSRYEEAVGADHDRALDLAELYLGAA